MKKNDCALAWAVVFFFTMLPIIIYAQKKRANTDLAYEILTPLPKPKPRINGPLMYGCRPGNPFIYRIPCQGKRPINFKVDGLPSGLKLDPETGIISGTTPARGEYQLVITATNSKGRDKRNFKIIAGDQLALTPPMGWNDWYAYFTRITDSLVRQAADKIVSSGMADVGYQYVNIDACWQNAAAHIDSSRIGTLRDEQGNIIPNIHFPDMKALTDYIHEKGLKAGIYSSPGPFTCGGGTFSGSYQHEEQDARQFAEWGFDFLKYDYCSYRDIVGKNPSLAELQKPYKKMGTILQSLDRDIVFNLCQYGYGDVWKWGKEVGGHSWRTAGDLGYSLDHVFEVALKNAEYGQYSGPGGWNDPDYIQIGWIGKDPEEGAMEPPELTKMPASMQYAYMSLWCLMAAPLMYSGEMSKLDNFTLNVLCNPEMIAVNQDPLGKSGTVITYPDSCFLMVKPLADGSKAVGLFNRGDNPTRVTVDWKSLQIEGRQTVRDLWRQKNLGNYRNSFSAVVPARGVVMIKVTSKGK